MTTQRKNEFSWSKSRDEVFQTCPRQYYFCYYASWGGWMEEAPDLTRELYVLKKLKNRYMWVGDLVHRAIQRTITNLSRGIAILEVERIVDITLNIMRNEFRSSRRANYRLFKANGLFEHEYGIEVPDSEWRSLAGDLERCLRNFYSSPFFGSLKTLDRRDFLEVETLSHFDFEGTRCWVVLDAAYRDRMGITIADWKTGQSDVGENELQLAGYALYAFDRWGAEPTALTLVEYNLYHDRLHRYHADPDTVERTQSYIRGSIADMRSLLLDKDENIPFGQDRFDAIQKRDVCSRCNFQKVCKPVFS